MKNVLFLLALVCFPLMAKPVGIVPADDEEDDVYTRVYLKMSTPKVVQIDGYKGTAIWCDSDIKPIE